MRIAVSEEVKKAKACERSRLWRLKNPDHNRDYYKTHKDGISERVKKFRDSKGRRSYQEQSRKWKAENRERVKEYNCDYLQEHLEQFKIYIHNRRARLVGNGGSYTIQELNNLFEEQEGFCFYCGKLLYASFDSEVHVDHKTPISRGGSNNIENIALACAKCNLSKHNKTAEEFFAVLRGW